MSQNVSYDPEVVNTYQDRLFLHGVDYYFDAYEYSDGETVVEFHNLPGCMTQVPAGESLVDWAIEALEAWLESETKEDDDLGE